MRNKGMAAHDKEQVYQVFLSSAPPAKKCVYTKYFPVLHIKMKTLSLGAFDFEFLVKNTTLDDH